jgi:hypothetical protein
MKRIVLLLPLAACGGPPANSTEQPQAVPLGPELSEEDESGQVPTEPRQVPTEPVAESSWSDWKSFTNVSPGPWISKTHGKRFVEIYVNDVALEAYKSRETALPVGSIVVKPSWENEDGKPGADGPLFVMEKMAAGFAPDSDDWLYVFQWQNPPEKWAAKIGTNVDWRSPSEKIEYCSDCHDVLDRGLGMPPKERMANW